MLLNEFLKEHRKVEQQEAAIARQNRKIHEQEATITQPEKGMKTVVARLEEQASQIQKVSAELERSKPTTPIIVKSRSSAKYGSLEKPRRLPSGRRNTSSASLPCHG